MPAIPVSKQELLFRVEQIGRRRFRMDQNERRIRTLKISSRDDTLLLQARHRLEEAFRTASLPGLPPNAQLLVRRLDLGSIRADQSPMALATRIGDMMRTLALEAVCVDHHSAANANVVWFSDPLQPCIALLSRLLDGNGAQEWYWRTLFPDRTLALNNATIEGVLMQAATTPLKGVATARLLQQLLEPPRLARLFSLITEALVRRLLHEQGLSPVAVAVMKRAIQTEANPESARTSQMQTVAAPMVNASWRQALQQAAECWGEQDVRTLWFAWQALIFHQPAWIERRELLQRIDPGEWLRTWSGNTAATVERKAEVAADAVSGKSAAGIKNDAAVLADRAPLSSTEPVAAAESASAAEIHEKPLVASESGQALPATRQDVAEALFNDTAGQQASDAAPAQVFSKQAVSHDTASGQSLVTLHSADAGFAFAIPLLQRLGMAELLERNESLLALDIPRQLLWSLAQRFGMDEGDPLQQLFAGCEPCGDFVIEQFHAPAIWQRLATRGLPPCCGSGIPAAIKRCASPYRGRNAAPTGTTSIQLHALINTMQLLGALYLRRHGGLSWRTLLQRSGRVLLTATHWDVIFDLNQIDLRLRRIALDSDPGWVAWLGRVVQFHYDSKGERYV